MNRIYLRKNDQVLVLTGKDRGKKGKILKVFPERQRAIVEGVQMVSKALRRSQDNPRGGIVRREGTIHISNLELVCPRCGRATRMAHTILADLTKKRVCKRCKEII